MTRQPQRGRGREVPPVPPAPGRQVFYLDAQLSAPGIQGPPVPGAPAPVPGVAAPVTGASASLSPYISPQGVPLSPGGPPNHLPPDSWPQAGFSPHPHLAQPGGPGVYEYVNAVPARPRNLLAADFAEFKRNPLILTAWAPLVLSLFGYLFGLFLCSCVLGLFLFLGVFPAAVDSGVGELLGFVFALLVALFTFFALFIFQDLLSVIPLIIFLAAFICAGVSFFSARTQGNLFAAAAFVYALFHLFFLLVIKLFL